MSRFRAPDLVVESKADSTPVTEVDRAVEEMIRRRLADERPGDGVVGEELGVTGRADRRWIVDPIDGTKSYVRGIPVWATLLALEEKGEVVVGVASAPALHRRWWAARGHGAFGDGEPLHVSRVGELGAAHLCFGDVDLSLDDEFMVRFAALARRCSRTRGFGDFWGHMLVAEGVADVMVEPAVSLWDLAAVQVIVEEAGGRLTDLDGVPRADGGSALSTNGVLHAVVLGALQGSVPPDQG